jgi:hypothetical protein
MLPLRQMISKTLEANTMTIRCFARMLLVLLAATTFGCGGGGGGGGSGGTTDTTPPTVSINAPTNNSTVNGTVAITASASDNVGVSKVEFYINGSLQATTTTAPYSFSWNTLLVPNGTYVLTAKAYDAANNSTTSSPVSATVVNGATKATLTLSIPSLPASTLVGGVQFVITLPQGVSPAIFSGNDASGSLTFIGGGTNLQGLSETNYNSTNNTITIAGATTTGFGAGNFLIVNCIIASGTTVTASNFSISNIQVIDTNAIAIPSATISMAVLLS